MDRKLIEAAKKGDVQTLHNMIKDDRFLLRSTVFLNGDNPLHTACMAGNLDFVKEVLSLLRPEFSVEINQHGLTPLAIASANGDLEIVKEILKVGNHLCLVKGKESRIPLHYAVSKGRIQVIRELASASLDSIFEVTVRGENCLHLAVKNCQFEAFKVLIEFVLNHKRDHIDVLNNKDGGENTILHHAASTKQYEVVDLLLDDKFGYKGILDVNSLNKNGVTPLDVLISNGGDCEIEEMLRKCGAARIEEINSLIQQVVAISDDQDQPNHQSQQEKRRKPSQKLQDYFKYNKINDSPSKVRTTLLILAVLIATATYQAVLSPPGGVWQDDYWPPTNNSSAKQSPKHAAGQAVMGTHNSVAYGMFLLFNSVGFFMSLQIIYFLTCGLPLQFELRVSLFALTTTYDTCMVAIAPDGKLALFFIIVSILMPAIIAILVVGVRDYNKVRPWPSTSKTAGS